jgi:4,5-dihydroxyphthalate decarboxylase
VESDGVAVSATPVASPTPLKGVRLDLAYGGLLYWDRTLALADGTVEPEGVALSYSAFEDPGDLFRRQSQHAEFPISEMSASTYVAMLSRNDDRFIAIPVFPSRHFRHAQVYIDPEASISHPSDLRGRVIGVLEYQMTAALWIRAFLQHDYGVRPSEISWVTGGLRTPEFVERLAFDFPPGVSLKRIPEDSTLEGMLQEGKISGLISAYPPIGFGGETCRAIHLFPDYRATEREYFARTRMFPIMHLVVIRRELYEQHRWLARSLYVAFQAAQEVGRRRLHQITGLAVSLPWLEAELEETRLLFGENPFAYGIEANRTVLHALRQYAVEQGITTRLVSLEEMFADEVLGT